MRSKKKNPDREGINRGIIASAQTPNAKSNPQTLKQSCATHPDWYYRKDIRQGHDKSAVFHRFLSVEFFQSPYVFIADIVAAANGMSSSRRDARPR